MSTVSKTLRDGLRGPIINITDPAKHDPLDIFKSYFREILVIARNYARPPSVDYEDLVSEGLIGLLDAINRFDPARATSEKAFRQLAIVRIKSAMFEFFLKNNTKYTIPNYMARAISLVDQIRTLVYSVDLIGEPEDALLNYQSEAFEKIAPEAAVLKAALLKGRVQNLAANSNRSYTEMVELVLRVEEDIQSYEAQEEYEISPEQLTGGREFLEKYLNNLQPAARDVIAMLLRGNTLVEIGIEKKLSRERIRQIKDKALEHLQGTRMYKDITE
jgi:RNA polymerase sigma factor (sigma-70 family)